VAALKHVDLLQAETDRTANALVTAISKLTIRITFRVLLIQASSKRS